VREYQGARYRYDARGNLTEKITPEGTTRLKWNSLNQLTEVDSNGIVTRFTYDPLGRRVTKHSTPSIAHRFDAGRQYHQREEARLSKEKQLGWTLYGWEGDRLAWESRDEESIHYLYELGSFIPLAQGVQNHPILLHKIPDWTDREYRFSEDPLWQQHPEAEPFQKLAFYHCDQIGTPMEMTDERGEIVWSAEYKAWGEARITAKEGYKNPLRFQGQYFDHETGLHYNRFRYYDPEIGRFISKDPIGLQGGLNLHSYAPNPVQWVDPLGLANCKDPTQRYSEFKKSDFCKEMCYAASHEKRFKSPDDFAKAIVDIGTLEAGGEHNFLHQPPEAPKDFHYSTGNCTNNTKVDIQYTLVGWALERQMFGSANLFYNGYSIAGRGFANSIKDYKFAFKFALSPPLAILSMRTNTLDKANLIGLQIGENGRTYSSFTSYANELCGCGL
jgi:RHS repeat-associated protein